MNLQALIQALQSLVPLVADAPVILHDLESGAETVLHTIGVDVSVETGQPTGNVTLKHGAPAPAPAPPSEPPPPPAGV